MIETIRIGHLLRETATSPYRHLVTRPTGAAVRLTSRDDLPAVVKAVVDRGLPVYGASAKVPSLEDVYFAVEARIAAAEGRDGRAPSAMDVLSGAVGAAR